MSGKTTTEAKIGKGAEAEGEKAGPEASTAPWLAEHYSVRLFDAAWESRHGAALGLIALFKAWRIRIMTTTGPGETRARAQGPWLRRWAEVSYGLLTAGLSA